MSKIGKAFFTLMFVTVTVFSQAPDQSRCRLTESNSPSVRGLRLGMTADEFLALFPGGVKRKEMMGAIEKARAAATGGELVYLSFYPATDSGNEQFSGIESVSAGLINARVADFTVVYGGATWNTIDEWVPKLSEAFKLPATQNWVMGPSETPNKILKCDGIMIEAAIQGASASIRIRNTATLRGIEDRANAAEEKRRRETKP